MTRGPFSRWRDVVSELPEPFVPAGTKGRILASAVTVFADEGFAGASVRTIAADVGINPATLYAHFSSKEAILLALVQIGSEELLRAVDEATAPAGDTAGRLDAFIAAAVTAHARYPRLAIVTTSAAPSVPRDAFAAAQTAGVVVARSLRTLLDEGQRDGTFSLYDLELTARTLEAMIQRVPRWVLAAPEPTAHVVAACGELARRMVAQPPSAGTRRTDTGKARE